MTNYIETEMLGTEATDQDRDRMVELLRERGYHATIGDVLLNLIDGTQGTEQQIPQHVWDECLSLLRTE